MTEFWRSAVVPYCKFWSLFPALILLSVMCGMSS